MQRVLQILKNPLVPLFFSLTKDKRVENGHSPDLAFSHSPHGDKIRSNLFAFEIDEK
jgi:hypothetical protein